MIDSLVSTFVAEASELLEDLEKALLHLEQDKHSKDSVGEVFRTMHSLKGSASMFGFDSISNFTHHLESIYQSIREGSRELTEEIFTTTLACLDHLRNLLKDSQMRNPETKNRHNQLLLEIEKLIQHEKKSESQVFTQNTTQEITYYILFKPVHEILRNGTNPLFLVDDLLQLGNGIAMPFIELPNLKDITADFSYTGFEIVLSTTKPEKEIQDVFLFVEGDAETEIKKLETETW
jgi:two-component system chemotaxis sensor kinase CheA